ncbi:BON domain-containing protein [Anabaenopsis elenkinii]|uniref:BON domain-containing protein n=1 Tax=Anabaenopsis elenkinii CCIBt3563 TaxID=2779889 RepID=A0A7S6RG01_9CYAN|nr:BON domain-containing protein [Anabaenopsis elenkinii]QOV23732.1 BON domain-containing protein [Anabaenopsis elenkinii CCIBt3563]
MGWLKRIFGLEKPPSQQVQPSAGTTTSIPPERLGLDGEYDQSGLAKRVALAFDQDSQLGDIDTLWVAQTGSTVVLKGRVPSQDLLKKMVAVARSVHGAASVNTDEVTVS